MKWLLLLISLLACAEIGNCQSLADTSKLQEVVVKAYFHDQPLQKIAASISIINQQALQQQPGHSLVSAINTAPGVRMEERSPGSYRLSIRGSLLRSPFGIRNVKVYLDDFILTDAGGNTYLNLIEPASVKRIEILKGPEGSVFGANSGGAVIVSSKQTDSSSYSLGVTVGSFGLLHQNVSAQIKSGKLGLAVNQGYQEADGYRENSSMKRKSLQVLPSWQYSHKSDLKALLLYSDLEYQTPGGLSFEQLLASPRSARPGTAFAPGAVEQKAGIFNKTVIAGLANTIKFSERLRHVVSLTGSITDFKNPFITTYETRDEKNIGLRTYIEMLNNKGGSSSWSWQYGLESQRSGSKKRNYENVKGSMGSRQDFVDFSADQSFLFSRFTIAPFKQLNLESALSYNFYAYKFEGLYPIESPKEKRSFKAQWLPRLAVSYLPVDGIALRASASKGYSAPTIEEVRPSNRTINTNLQPEIGWNFEAGLRVSAMSNRIYLDAVAFNFHLNNSIVRRVDAADAEYFVNAGGTKQKGVELQLNGWLLPLSKFRLLQGVRLNESYTLSDFKFSDYIVTDINYSGKNLTGVPKQSIVSSVELHFPLSSSIFIQHSHVGSIPLNDANTASASAYNLLQAKLIFQKKFRAINVQFFAGADNLLNADYSLGNDLNAFGARYYNAAAVRNLYGGLSLSF